MKKTNYMSTGKTICDFIKSHEAQHGIQPTWLDITEYLTAIKYPTKRGGPWRQSSAQAALLRYCEVSQTTYPLDRRKNIEKIETKRCTEITVTLKITVDADANVTVDVAQA
jgi:hypothetical protein|tara:strand:+ start:1717 stop:2049 length:333 start_codon:yes stop_codon:yes gene_type:complete